MESKGRIVETETHWLNPNDIATISVTLEIPFTFDIQEKLDGLRDKDIKVSLYQWREPRSKSANAYFHLLSDKLADHMRMSKPKMKNYLLFHYGQKCRDKEGRLVVLKTNADEEELITRSDVHMWYLKDSEDEKPVPMYVLLEHSRFFDSLQMSVLIDGVVQECKAVGIEVLPPDEIERLKQAWGVEGLTYEKHHPD